MPSRLYPNPSEAENQKYRNNPYSDPWISRAWVDISASTEKAQGRDTVGACGPKLYNGGRWSGYAELAQAAHQVREDLSAQCVQFCAFTGHNNARGVALIDLKQNNGALDGWLIQDGAAYLRPARADCGLRRRQLSVAGGGCEASD